MENPESRTMLRFEHCDIGPLGQTILRDFSWTVQLGETWIITGPNGSGKSALASAIAGELPVQAQAAGQWFNLYSDQTEIISFDRQQAIILNEFRNDDSDFVEGGVDRGTSARRFIIGDGQAETPEFKQLCTSLAIDHLLDRGIKYLSTGEIRKVLLCRDLLKKPALLILDELAEGLDGATRQVLAGQIDSFLKNGQPRLIIVSDRYQALPALADRVLCLEDRRLAFAGKRGDFESSAWHSKYYRQTVHSDLTEYAETLGGGATPPTKKETLIDMKNVQVAWDGRQVLADFNWTLQRGDHTLIRGPNGCGKTTLLKLITGDNPQVYANQVRVLGHLRGSGESIWEIKAQIGYVSYQFHLDYLYYGQASLMETLLSGFHDSIGLYENPGFMEREKAEKWLSIMGLSEKRQWGFNQLSYGEQRAALVARAAIKSPRILILDEPCHGLDREQRQRVLDIADYIGSHTASTLLYVTHDPEEMLACTRQVLDFIPTATEGQSADGYLPPRFRHQWTTVQPSI